MCGASGSTDQCPVCVCYKCPSPHQVCWEAPPAVQLLPCKHTVLCRRCSDALRKQEGQECPMCRTPVRERVDVRV
jgi:hypothetical protein